MGLELFSVELPNGAMVKMGNTATGKTEVGLILSTHTAAELIGKMADEQGFCITGPEREALVSLSFRIAGRYSGH